MLPWLPAALVAGPALLAFALTILNLAFWRRPRVRPARKACTPVQLSVCIPARNEEQSIERCVRAALASGAHEIVVFDDGSSDATAERVKNLQHYDARVHLVRGDGRLPAGWVGKPHACARLAEAASGDVLVFVDADVVLAAGALVGLQAAAERAQAGLITAVPRQEMASFFERLVLPFLHVTYLSWLFLPLVTISRDPRFAAANGQIVWITRDALEEIGGFAAVRADIVDDMALVRAAKRAGVRTAFVDGFCLARCRMYRCAGDVVRGFSKNLHEGVGSTRAVVLVVILYIWSFVLPPTLLIGAPLFGAWGSMAVVGGAVGSVAALLQRLLLCVRFRQSVVSAILFPVGALCLVGIAINSVVWARQQRIAWKDRIYPGMDKRVTS